MLTSTCIISKNSLLRLLKTFSAADPASRFSRRDHSTPPHCRPTGAPLHPKTFVQELPVCRIQQWAKDPKRGCAQWLWSDTGMNLEPIMKCFHDFKLSFMSGWSVLSYSLKQRTKERPPSVQLALLRQRTASVWPQCHAQTQVLVQFGSRKANRHANHHRTLSAALMRMTKKVRVLLFRSVLIVVLTFFQIL